MLPKKGDYAQQRHKAACVAHPCKPSSVARTLQHGATAPRYNVHHHAYYTLLPFLYRRRIFSFPSPNTVSAIGGRSCCGGSDCDSAQHRMRHTCSLSCTVACGNSQMDGGRAMPFYAGCIVSQNGSRPVNAQRCITQCRFDRPVGVTHTKAQQCQGIAPGRGTLTSFTRHGLYQTNRAATPAAV